MADVFAYIGTYSDDREDALFVCRYHPGNGSLERIDAVQGLKNPTFLALHPDGKTLYAISEIGSFDGKRAGGVSALRVDRSTGQLSVLGAQNTVGPGPCHVAVDPGGRCVAVANYGGGSVASYAVQADGSLGEAASFFQHEGRSVHPKRQGEPHAHSVTFAPDGRHLYVADLGLDKLMIYRVDGGTGRITPGDPASAATHAGAGPRHMAFHPAKPWAYVINELDATLTVFEHDPASGALTAGQTVSTLPGDWEGAKSCADVHVSRDGRFVYGSNRGHDSVAVFSVDGDSGALSPFGHVSTGGRVPRNFALDPAGNFLLAANQDSGDVVTFRLNPATGMPEPSGTRLEIPKPVCIKFLVVP